MPGASSTGCDCSKAHHPGIPVIVVGNLTVGGSGKTPLVLWIAEFLQEQRLDARHRLARLRRPGWPSAARRDGRVGPAEVGDEPMLLARRSGCPVWVGAGPRRGRGALRARIRTCDVLVLDDGLQHYALRRDVEIAVVDARGFGNGFLLPAGPLREPLSRLRSVDAVVSHGTLRCKGYRA